MFVLASCDMQVATPVPTELVVMGYENFKIPIDMREQFERENNIKVQVITFNSAELMLGQIGNQSARQGDVIYGLDNLLLVRALSIDAFEVYTPTQLSRIPVQYQLDPTHRLIPVEVGYITLNYDKAWFDARRDYVKRPTSLKDLVSEDNKQKLFHKFVMPHPRKSPVGFAFLLATIATFPENSPYTWQQFWKDMQQRLVHVTDTWQQAYMENFSATTKDQQEGHPLVVSFASSPAVDVMLRRVQEPPMANVEGVAFEQPRFVGIRKGTKARRLAEKFVEFVLSEPFQREIPKQMYNYPVLPDVPLPDSFVRFAPRPTQIVNIAPDAIYAYREQWLRDWGKLVMLEE